MQREKALLKNMVVLGFGTVFPKIASLITLPLITAYLTVEEYGIYDLILTIASLFLPVATLQMQAAAFRFLVGVRDNIHEQKKIISNILSFTIITTVLALAVLFICMNNIEIKLKLLVVIYYFLDIIVITFRQIARGLSKNTIYSISVITNSFGELLLVVVLLWCMHAGIVGALLALIISLAISAVFISVKLKLFSLFEFNLVSKKILKELISYSWPMIPNSLSSWVMSLSDRLVLTAMLGVSANAIYAVANKLPNLFGIVQSSFNLAWQENASVSVDDMDSSKYYGKMFSAVFKMLIGFMGILIGCAPILFLLLIRGDYDSAYIHISILFMAALFSSMSSYLGGIYVAHKKTKEIGITTTVSAILNVLIDLLLVKKIGIFAASLSTVISYLILVVFRMHDVQRIQKIKFDYKLVALGVSLLTGMCFICSVRNRYLNIANFIFGIAIAIIFNKDLIGRVLQKVKQRMDVFSSKGRS